MEERENQRIEKCQSKKQTWRGGYFARIVGIHWMLWKCSKYMKRFCNSLRVSTAKLPWIFQADYLQIESRFFLDEPIFLIWLIVGEFNNLNYF